MALANHAALLGTIGDDVELLALAVLDDLADNGSAFNNGSANLNSALLANGQDFSKVTSLSASAFSFSTKCCRQL